MADSLARLAAEGEALRALLKAPKRSEAELRAAGLRPEKRTNKHGRTVTKWVGQEMPSHVGFAARNHAEDGQRFIVRQPRAPDADVQVFDRFSHYSDDEHVATVSRRVWDAISGDVANYLNSRIDAVNRAEAEREPSKRRVKIPRGKWGKPGHNPGYSGGAHVGAGETHMDRLLGKEMAVLLWALAAAPERDAAEAVRRWKQLSPEEHWWLYNQGRHDPAWRHAITVALHGVHS